MKIRPVSERRLQIGIVQMIRRHNILVFSVPNGGSRDIREARNLKAEGLLAGVPDLTIVLPDGRAAFLEIKTPKGVLSKAQQDFRDWALSNDIPWALARNIDDAEDALRSWLGSGNPQRVGVALAGKAEASPPPFKSAEAPRVPA